MGNIYIYTNMYIIYVNIYIYTDVNIILYYIVVLY